MDEMKRYEPLSVGGWIWTMILLSIPILNVIMIFVWAFGKGNVGRKHFAIAELIIILVVVLSIVACFIILGFEFPNLNELITIFGV